MGTPNGDESGERSAIQPVTIGAETLAAEPIEGLCDNVEADDDVWIPSAGDFVIRDVQTGSLWNLRGQAFEGPCKGAQLEQVPGYTVFWFSWSATHHGGEIWNRDEKNMPGEIEPDPDGPCNVPCEEIRSGGPPPDGIPALDHEGRWERPKAQAMVEPDAPEAEYLSDSDRVAGVYLEGEARAYPYPILNWHEIHIDQIGDTEFNLTYCPLTGSALLIPVDQGEKSPLHLYVSGRLYNDNLTMFQRGVDQQEATFWNQVLRRGIRGPRRGERLEIAPVTETTWERWKEMHPDTLVTSVDTGFSRSYGRNPYDSRQESSAKPLMPINPEWETFYANKEKVLSLEGEDIDRAYPLPELQSKGERVVVHDELEGQPLLIVYEKAHRMVVPFSRVVAGQALTFEGDVAP